MSSLLSQELERCLNISTNPELKREVVFMLFHYSLASLPKLFFKLFLSEHFNDFSFFLPFFLITFPSLVSHINRLFIFLVFFDIEFSLNFSDFLFYANETHETISSEVFLLFFFAFPANSERRTKIDDKYGTVMRSFLF